MTANKRGPESGGIAIVGMACLFPGAPNLETYWRNIVDGIDCVSDPPEDAWDIDTFYDPDSTSNDRVYCKRGGHIGSLALFDPLANGVMPKAVEGGEPDQWLALKVARDAFADAGYGDEISERQSTAVILGKGTYLNSGNVSVIQHGRILDQTIELLRRLHPEYEEAELAAIRAELKGGLPPFNADTAPSLIPNVVAGRIANRLDLMGPNYTVDAACASSLVALEHAVRGLEAGEFDLALVGGVHVATPVPTLMLFCQLGALSRQEKIRPFDRSADGTLLGGGVGMVVLKRQADAIRDHHRIYATVRGVGVSSDGRGLGVTAPRLEGEILALRRAYEKAGLPPGSIELIEAHGTGTPVGDQTEIKALHEVFGSPGGSLPRCAIGSVKSMISHLMPASGIAGLIKSALALHHKTLPPTLNVEEPNPELGLERTTFYINSETRPWIHASEETPRRSGVNSFGFGGINAHAILEESSASERGEEDNLMPWDSEVLLLSAESRDELIARAENLERTLAGHGDIRLADLAFTLNSEWEARESRLAIVASSIEDAREKLRRSCNRLRDPECHRIQEVQGIFYFDGPAAISGKLAFLFPGEGSQYVNMLADLCLRLPDVRRSFDLIDRIFSEHERKFVPSDFIFPRPAFSDHERRAAEQRLWQMEGAFEAVQTANWALYSLLEQLQVRPDALLGHSTGEYTAMLAGGMIELEDDHRIERFAIDLNDVYHEQTSDEEGASGAALIAVAADSDAIWEACRPNNGEIHVAMNNCPHQTVIAGRENEIGSALERLQESGLIYERLPFDRPYHTPLFESCAMGLRQFLAKWITAAPRIPTYSCTTANRFPDDPEQIREIAIDHWMRPVEFRNTIRAMYEDGVRLFVEVGPRGSLSAFVGDILRGQPHLALPVNSARKSGIRQLNAVVGLLAAHGVPIQPEALYSGRRLQKVDLGQLGATEDRRAGRDVKLRTYWIPMGLSEESAARLRHREIPEARSGGAAEAPVVPQRVSETAPPGTPTTDEVAGLDHVMSTHHRTMERFLALQQEVMGNFLSTGSWERTVTSELEAFAETDLVSAPDESSPEVSDVPPARVDSSVTAIETDEARGEREAKKPEAEGGGDESPAKAIERLDIERLLLDIVSDRTGYPPEMLGLDMDIEADLGIDSIKRVEFLGSFQQQTGLLQGEDMEALAACKTLREVIEFFADQNAGKVPVQPAEARGTDVDPDTILALPFIDRIISFEPGRAVEAEREINLDRDLFLRDHVLGQPTSESDPGRIGLPLIPFTASMEMLAEAASLVKPDRTLVAMNKVTGHRWIALEDERLTLRVQGKVSNENPDHVHVQLFTTARENADVAGETVFEGTMVFAATYPEAPADEPADLSGETSSTWTPDRMYEDGMFHGPLFRGVESMDQTGDDGARATLVVPSRRGFLAETDEPEFLADPVLLDQPGQVVGLWTAEKLDRGRVIFPFYLEELRLYGPALAAGERLRCFARISLAGEQLVSSDLQVTRTDGRVWARLVGWKDRRFDLPPAFLDFLRRPSETQLSEAWTVAGSNQSANVEARRLPLESLPAELTTAGGRIWARTLARLVLSARELAFLRDSNMTLDVELRWLLRQIVAKDAVRGYLSRHYDLTVSPADIVILPDASGRPSVDGAWRTEVAEELCVTASESGGTAVALVTGGAGVAAMGVDIGITPARGEISLAEEERALVGSLSGVDTQEWPLRISCAKEAVAKALGRDVSRAAKELHADHLDPGSGTVRLRPMSGDRSDTGSSVPDELLVAQTRREDNLIIATFFCKVPSQH